MDHGLLERLREASDDPGVSAQQIRSLQEEWLASLSEEERRVYASSGQLPSRRSKVRRVIDGVSQEADALFTMLARAGGKRSVASLAENSVLAPYVNAAATELTDLGLVEQVGKEGRDRLTLARVTVQELRLTPEAEGTVLISSWSMRG